MARTISSTLNKRISYMTWTPFLVVHYMVKTVYFDCFASIDSAIRWAMRTKSVHKRKIQLDMDLAVQPIWLSAHVSRVKKKSIVFRYVSKEGERNWHAMANEILKLLHNSIIAKHNLLPLKLCLNRFFLLSINFHPAYVCTWIGSFSFLLLSHYWIKRNVNTASNSF